jgi:hypothetical protein
MSEETEKVGSVSQSRYDEIVAELRQVVEQQTRGSFTIGDRALEIEPMCERGGQHGALGQELFTVRETLFRLAEDIKQRLNLTMEPVSRPKDASGFVVLPRRWVVERSLAWMMHARRHARDYERLIQHSETVITWAAITLMTRRLARKGATPSWPRKPATVDG